MPRILAVIPARGGSKSIPRKNIADVCGKPLIAYMIEHAAKVSEITDLVVSTEDREIADVAAGLGAQVPFLRPPELAEDDTPSLPVVQHAVREMEKRTRSPYDYIVLLQATAPLCRPRDIEAVCRRLVRGDCQSVVTVIPVSSYHPFRMKRIVGDDTLINYIDQGFEDMRPRQVLPPVYKRSGAVYASTRTTVMDLGALVGPAARAVIVPEMTGIDIDNPIDLAMVRLILGGEVGDLADLLGGPPP